MPKESEFDPSRRQTPVRIPVNQNFRVTELGDKFINERGASLEGQVLVLYKCYASTISKLVELILIDLEWTRDLALDVYHMQMEIISHIDSLTRRHIESGMLRYSYDG